MAYFDYSRPDVPDFSEGIRRLGDDLAIAMKRKQEREQHEQQLAFEQQKLNETLRFQREQETRRYDQQKAQFDYQNRIEDRKEKVARQDFNMRQQAFHNQQAKEIQAQLAAGNIEGARRIAAQTTTFDPETGRETSRGTLEQGPARAIGAEPLMPESGTTVGPDDVVRRDQVESADPVTLIMDPRANERRQAAADAANMGRMRRYDTEAQAYSEEAKRAEAERPYTFKLGPNDPGVSMSIRGQRNELWERNANDFMASLSGVPMTDADKVAAANITAALKGGADPTKAREAYNKERLTGISEFGKNTRNTEDNETRIDVAKINASRPRSSMIIGQGNLDMKQFEQFQKDAKRLGDEYGLKVDLAGMKQLEAGLTGVTSKNNALERGVVFQLTRSMQGVGPLTQQDVDQIRVDIAGKLGTLESAMTRLQSGGLGDAEKKVFYDAIQKRKVGQLQRMQDARAYLDSHFHNEASPYRGWVGDPFIKSQLDAMLPGTISTFNPEPPAGGGPPEVRAKRKGKAKAAAKTAAPKRSVDDILNEQ